jgi:hypothetical protein
MDFTKLVVKGVIYSLHYDYNILCDCEDRTSCPNLLVAIQRQGSNSATELRGLLFALTREKHPKLTLEQCGAMINVESLKDIQLAVMESCMAAVSKEFLEQWKASMEEGDAQGQTIPNDTVQDVDDEDEPEVVKGEHILSFDDYRAGKAELSHGELCHAMKCDVCMPLLNEANKERMTVVN